MENELRTVENGIVTVYETDTGEKFVYGRELWKVLESKQQFTDWIKNRFNECDAIENEDYEIFHKFMKNSRGGRPAIEYIIRLDVAKEIAMLERNEKGKQVRRYFIELERKYREQQRKAIQLIERFGESISKINARVEKLEEMIEGVEKHAYLGKNCNPYGLQDDATDRLEILNDKVTMVSELYGTERNKTLQYLYKAIERAIKVPLSSYLMVYRAESEDKNAGMFHVIVDNDRLYELAIEINDDAIKRKEIYG